MYCVEFYNAEKEYPNWMEMLERKKGEAYKITADQWQKRNQKSINGRYQSRQGTELGSTVHLSCVYKFSLFDRKFINFSIFFVATVQPVTTFNSLSLSLSRAQTPIFHFFAASTSFASLNRANENCLVERLDVFHTRTCPRRRSNAKS